jgi:hypothetical protein
MLKDQGLFFSLHGVLSFLETDYEPFLGYARTALAALPAGVEAIPDVITRLHWNALPPSLWSDGQVRRWGRRLLQIEERVLQTEVLELPGLQLEARWAGGRFVLDAYYRPLSRRDRLAQRLGRTEARLFAILCYYLAYFPLIHFLEQTRGLHLLHGAAVSQPKGGYLIGGLPGSGKSTFSLALLADPQAQLLSDNLVLFDAEKIYACPEMVHLSQSSQSLLPAEARQRLVETGRVYSHERRDHAINEEARAWETRPRALILLHLGPQVSCRTISSEKAVERLQSFDCLAKEINAYVQFTAPLELVAPKPGASGRRQETLAALISQAACFELQLEQGGDLLTASHQARQMEIYA